MTDAPATNRASDHSVADKDQIRPAATVLLVRDDPFEVLMVKRHHQIDFASGALVFPGGKLCAGDSDPAWAGHADGWTETTPDERALKIAGLREVYEETGILLARGEGGAAFCGDEGVAAQRDAVAKDGNLFLPLLRELGLRLDLTALTRFARWIAPKIAPKRFDTFFYLAHAPADQLAACDGWETVDVEWIAPAEALRLETAGERTIIFPTRMNLRLLGESGSVAAAFAAAEARPATTVEPRVERRETGGVLTLDPAWGYGAVEEPLGRIGV